MNFLEFLYHHGSGVSLALPTDIIIGKITGISYKTNPIQLTVQKKDGGSITASFKDRFVYDYMVRKQNPEVGKNIEMHLGPDKVIKSIKITSSR
jgi:hypothetical protein